MGNIIWSSDQAGVKKGQLVLNMKNEQELKQKSIVGKNMFTLLERQKIKDALQTVKRLHGSRLHGVGEVSRAKGCVKKVWI